MTPTWFDSPARIAALAAAAQPWLGTPFRANSAIPGPGGGVSCHNLFAELYFATGFLDRFPVPAGSPRALRLHGRHPLIEYLDGPLGHRFAALAPGSELLPGDAVGFGRRNDVHLGLVLGGGAFVHVAARAGVMISLLADPTFADAVRTIRRPQP